MGRRGRDARADDRLGFTFIEVKPSDLASSYVHGTQGKIGALFARARAQRPSLLFFDELDALVPHRDGQSVGQSCPSVST